MLAHGINPDETGGQIVCVETASGGEVFSVGSISYPASLLVEEPLAHMTKNAGERILR